MTIYKTDTEPENTSVVWDKNNDRWSKQKSLWVCSYDKFKILVWQDLLLRFGPLTDNPPLPKEGEKISTLNELEHLPNGSVIMSDNAQYVFLKKGEDFQCTDPVIGTVKTFWFWGRPLDLILLKLGEDS